MKSLLNYHRYVHPYQDREHRRGLEFEVLVTSTREQVAGKDGNSLCAKVFFGQVAMHAPRCRLSVELKVNENID